MMYFLLSRNLFVKQVIGFSKKNSSFYLQPNILRCLCSQPVTKNVSPYTEEPIKLDWIPIYHFPHIHLARLMNRLKLYQSVFTFSAVPLSIGMFINNMTDLMTVSIMTGASIFTCATLYLITSYFKRLIGVIFVSKDGDHVKIAHLTFWGNRNDVVVPVNEIIPFSDGSCNPNDAFVKLYRTNTDEVLYLTLRFGRFLDEEKFQIIFGNFDVIGLKKEKL